MKKAIQWTRGERIAGWIVFAGVFALACLTLFAVVTETHPRDLEASSDLVLQADRLVVHGMAIRSEFSRQFGVRP